ncbi:MAG TPA: hypothetical protein VNN07_06995 [Candidatus Tectomicrobia bacterium]|nr:hypothetical protein [Candidatus Tectomicrobia bacterium]
MSKAIAIAAVAAAVAATAAGAAAAPPASSFVQRVDNPWFPLAPGTRYEYRGVKDGRPAREVVTVTRRTTTIEGVRCTTVDDRLYVDGRLAERTTDWYAQDRAGNVWYFGEDTAELDRTGRVTSRSGSWRAGARGARAGIVMPARPRIGQRGQEEFLEGEAEDRFRVLAVLDTVLGRRAASALLVEETTPLEPGVVDHKLYVRGVGLVVEQTVEGGDERSELVRVTRAG